MDSEPLVSAEDYMEPELSDMVLESVVSEELDSVVSEELMELEALTISHNIMVC